MKCWQCCKKYPSFDLLEQFEHIRFRDENNLIQIMKDIYAKTNRLYHTRWRMGLPVPENISMIRLHRSSISTFCGHGLAIGLCGTGLYDRNSAYKKIIRHTSAQYVHRIFYDRTRRTGNVFGFTGTGSTAALWNTIWILMRHGHGMTAMSWFLIGGRAIFITPCTVRKSVVEAMSVINSALTGTQTETYEAQKVYIQMDMDGLKDAVVKMLGQALCASMLGGNIQWHDEYLLSPCQGRCADFVRPSSPTYDSGKNETVTIPQ